MLPKEALSLWNNGNKQIGSRCDSTPSSSHETEPNEFQPQTLQTHGSDQMLYRENRRHSVNSYITNTESPILKSTESILA